MTGKDPNDRGEPHDDALHAVGKPVRRKGSRRVVLVSEVDAKRIKSGEFDSVENVLHASDRTAQPAPPRPTTSPSAKEQSSGVTEAGEKKPRLSPRDREILDDVPPHFGKL